MPPAAGAHLADLQRRLVEISAPREGGRSCAMGLDEVPAIDPSGDAGAAGVRRPPAPRDEVQQHEAAGSAA